MVSLENLPFELYSFHIFEYIKFNDMMMISKVSKKLNKIVRDDWDSITRRTIGFDPELKDNVYLFPYQLKCIKWAFDRFSEESNIGLHIDMGLGKTIMSLMCLKNTKNNLVVCPKNIMNTWAREIKKFTNLKFLVFHSDYVNIKSNINYDKVFDKYNVVIASYSSLRAKKGTSLFNREWNTIILDECHKIVDPKTTTYKRVMELEAYFKIVMSGTMMINKFKDITSILTFLGVNDTHQNFLDKLYNYHIYRLDYETAGVQLPVLIKHDIKLELDDIHREIYSRFRSKFNDIYSQFMDKVVHFSNVLAVFTRLRQVCICPYLICLNKEIDERDFQGPFSIMKDEKSIWDSVKFLKTIEIITDVIKKDEKVIVMSKFSSALRLLSKLLHEQEFSDKSMNTKIKNHILVDGETKGRDKLFRDFNKTRMTKYKTRSIHNNDILLANTDITSMGVNLTSANHIIILEPWWNSASPDQSIARIHRIGQKKECHVYNLIVNETIECMMLEMCEEKEKKITSVQGPGKMSKVYNYRF